MEYLININLDAKAGVVKICKSCAEIIFSPEYLT
jgi:hypothetical protein